MRAMQYEDDFHGHRDGIFFAIIWCEFCAELQFGAAAKIPAFEGASKWDVLHQESSHSLYFWRILEYVVVRGNG
ncbi:hypothetical protein ANCCAN_05074 [Ancylostoma caninum]|uniref:Uncharacterized protein n=1 Tax=Ancylostoma caninum TaxID=29170 RepID=A0A368GWS3_ANCCA|nr:hypothetical protein ANCCAN_05074 [Ancylostoma caninum]